LLEGNLRGASERLKKIKEGNKMKSKKFLAFVFALAFVFSAMGLAFAPSSALAANAGQYLSGDAIPPNPLNPNGSTYEIIGEPVSTDAINVTLIIEAGQPLDEDGYVIPSASYLRKEIKNVSIGGGTAPNTVTSLLYAVDGTNGLKFYGEDDDELVDFTASTTYLAAVEYGGNQWVDGAVAFTWLFNGWAVRINDKYPVRLTSDEQGYEGTGIIDTPLADGDVVHLFYDFPSNAFGGSGNLAAKYVRAVYDGYDGTNTLTVQLQGHNTYINPSNYVLEVNNYRGEWAEGVTASIYTEDGILVQDGVQSTTQTVTIDNETVVQTVATFQSNLLEAGETYIVKTNPVYYTTDNSSWWDVFNGAFFVLTGAYDKIEIPE
jgi:hypothetical protein